MSTSNPATHVKPLTDEQRDWLAVETAVALAALTELLADGEGLASLNDYRRAFREKFAERLLEVVK